MLRFIIYTIPVLNTASALLCSHVWSRRKEQILFVIPNCLNRKTVERLAILILVGLMTKIYFEIFYGKLKTRDPIPSHLNIAAVGIMDLSSSQDCVPSVVCC